MDQPLPSPGEQGMGARDIASWEAQHVPERAETKGGIAHDLCWSCSQFAGTAIVFPCMVSKLIARVRELEGALGHQVYRNHPHSPFGCTGCGKARAVLGGEGPTVQEEKDDDINAG